ncbi:thioesterase II family protein [Streptomyces sp. NPDC051677]|uniref:thioesterase II family protein n=1 Tax=Streptomyces sp. NPDC051677 TaxID=3365669 RepID=UPI0037D1A1BF
MKETKSTSQHAASLWLRCYRTGPPEAMRLVVFPHAGGSASYYREFCATLSDRFNTFAMQYPGRQDRRHEPSPTDLHTLSDQLFDELKGFIDRPMAFFGHSMGAVLAFEVARRFEQRLSHPLEMLFVSGRRASTQPRDEAIDPANDDDLLAEIQKLSGTDPRLLGYEDMLHMILEPLRADYLALNSYTSAPTPVLRTPITALTGAADPRTTKAEANAWRDRTTGPFDLCVFPGGHFFVREHHEAVTTFVAEKLSSLQSAP